MPDKFCVDVGRPWQQPWEKYFENFYHHCQDIAMKNDWHIDTVCNYQLRPYGKLIKTKTQGWYLRWDHAMYHTAFVLRWQ